MTNEEEFIYEIDKNSRVRLHTPVFNVGLLFSIMYLVFMGVQSVYIKGEAVGELFPVAVLTSLLFYTFILNQVSKLDNLKLTIKNEADFMNKIPVYNLEGEQIVGEDEASQRATINSALKIKINFQLFFYKWVAPIPILIVAGIIVFQEVKLWN